MSLSNLHFEVVPNEPRHPGPTCEVKNDGTATKFILAIMEFDDQGLPFDRAGFKDIEASLGGLKFPIIIVFVHGWRHNADAEDENLIEFKNVLAQTAGQQQALGTVGRPVFGVFVGWRGLSTAGNDAWEYLSFWDRQQAAERVAHGSARELLGRLKAFRNSIDTEHPRATLIIIGHSFGGLIVYTAIAQSLIEAAATSNSVVPSFGDLVLLVNPAFSAVSYLPIYSILWSRKFDSDQLPVFVSVTAENDMATKDAFPAANLRLHVEEATRGSKESQALTRTMGHLNWLQTHQLSEALAPAAAAAAAAAAGAGAGAGAGAPQQNLADVVGLSAKGAMQSFGTVAVKRLDTVYSEDSDKQVGSPDSPFWVAKATPAVVDGHNGIWTKPFESFVQALVAAHLEHAAKAKRLRCPSSGLTPSAVSLTSTP